MEEQPTDTHHELSGIEKCDCPMQGESDGSLPRCHADGPNGVLCSRPEGHPGEHVACAPNAHPLKTWGDGDE